MEEEEMGAKLATITTAASDCLDNINSETNDNPSSTYSDNSEMITDIIIQTDIEIKMSDSDIKAEDTLPVKAEKEQLSEFTVIDVDDGGCNENGSNSNVESAKQDSRPEENQSSDLETPTKSEVMENDEVKQSPELATQDTKNLANEAIELQLDNTEVLDSYLDKRNDDELANNSGKSNIVTTIKEEAKNISSINKSTDNEKVCDSLILTADDELETEEISLEEKSGKANNKGIKTKKSANVNDDDSSAIQDAEMKSPKTMKHEKGEENDGKNETETTKSRSASDTIKKEKKTINGNPSRVLWVSNVTQSIRASELKHYISKIGKVVTAKIVTDGKKCYGYIMMDNAEDASKCVKNLDNAYFEGRKLNFSFTRPQRSIPEKKDDQSKSSDNTNKSKSSKREITTVANNTDDEKVKSKTSNKTTKSEAKRKRKSCSRSSSSRVSKRHSSNDPLTTRFDFKRRPRSRSRRASSNRFDRRDYLREREERDRLKRRLLEEQRRNRDEMLRQIQREEKHREMEFKLEHERRKLQLERELFEKERRELTRLDAERRKIERERIEVLEQRTKLQEEIQKTRLKTKTDEFAIKNQDAVKGYEKRKEPSKDLDDDYRKPSNSKNLYQKPIKDNRDDRKISNDNKNATSIRRSVQKPERIDFQSVKESGKGIKSYIERAAPPPPKLSNDFDIPAGRKGKNSDRKHDYPDAKPGYVDTRKSERGGRKIEVIDRKFYSERSNDIPERKHERLYRKSEFEDRKPHVFPERKYGEYGGRDAKRYRDEPYSERDPVERISWPPASSVNYNEQWKSVPPGPMSGSSSVRYQETNFSASPYGGGPSRIPPFYYHPVSAAQDFQRYDHCSQVNGRKYN